MKTNTLFFILFLPVFCFSQNIRNTNTEILYGGGGYGSNLNSNDEYKYRNFMSIGTPTMNEFEIKEQTIEKSIKGGFGPFSFLLQSSQRTKITASGGDYPDKVLVQWETDNLDGPLNKKLELYKDGILLGRFSPETSSYEDVNVYSGEMYQYTIRPFNSYGAGTPVSTIGYVNPNGKITGKITSLQNIPVYGVEVALDPYQGKSLNFNSDTNWVEFPNFPADFFEKKAFTIEFWSKVNKWNDKWGNRGIILQKWHTEGVADNSLIIYSNGEFVSKSKKTSIPAFNLNEWHHFAYVVKDGKLSVWVDSILVKTDTGHNFSTTTYPLRLGNLGNNLHDFNGHIDDVRIWDAARDSAQIISNMHRVVESYSMNLISNWRMDEGVENKIFDITQNSYDGYITNGHWSDDIADVKCSAFTDESGNFIIDGIYYKEFGTSYTVYPEKKYHSFTPANKLVTLSSSGSSSNSVNFTDDSQITVSGYVSFAGYSYYEDSVEIKELVVNKQGQMDTVSLIPNVFTDKKGHYICEFEPGTKHTLIAVKKNHVFIPESFYTGIISAPLANKNFHDNTFHVLTGNIFGGKCHYPLNTTFEVVIENKDNNFKLVRKSFNNGNFSIGNLPADHFEVSILSPNPVYSFNALQTDLSEGNDTVEFIYTAPMEIEVSGLSKTECGTFYVRQYDQIPLNITAFERYGNNKCLLNDITFTITNEIGQLTTPKSYKVNSSNYNPETSTDSIPVLKYNLIPGRPNILDGGEHPYQKYFTVNAKGKDNRECSSTLWAYVLGHNPRQKTFTSRLPEIPTLILHDPPGDKSYSEVLKKSSFTNSFTSSVNNSDQLGFGSAVKFGFVISVGFLLETEIKAQTTITNNITTTLQTNSSDEFINTMTFEDGFKTSDADNLMGSDDDLFIGNALDVIYGVSDVIDLDGCNIVKSKALFMNPTGFATNFVYTESHIKNSIIPALYLTGDSASANAWKQILASNEQNKLKAQKVRNVSFSSGSSVTHTEELTKTEKSTFDWSFKFDHAFKLELDVEAAGDGFDLDFTYEYGHTKSAGSSSINSNTVTTKYVLEDNDEGKFSDYFSVDVCTDPVYGTPVFKTLAGTSSCPWEAGTQKRENVQLQIKPIDDPMNAIPGSENSFKIIAGNTSESNEDGNYYLRLINESNPYGAVIKVNGQVLSSEVIPMFIPSGQQLEYTLTVEKGPVEYEYDNLRLMISSACEYDSWLASKMPLVIADTVTFSVHFIEPCANNISIYYPSEDFLMNQSDSILNIGITGYKRNDPYFNYLLVEYQHATGNNSWIVADTIPKDSLSSGYYNYSLDLRPVFDDSYRIRIVDVCTDGTESISNQISGIIDRSCPELIKDISPVDRVLNQNDIIELEFSDLLDENLLTPDKIHLYNESTGLDVPFKYYPAVNKITVVPDVQNRFIENCYLKLTLDEISDLYNNKTPNPIVFEFLVDRNPIHWNNNRLSVKVPFGKDTTLVTSIHNNGTTSENFRFNGEMWSPVSQLNMPMKDYITTSPVTGELNPGGSQEIQIHIRGVLNPGVHRENIYMHTSQGDDLLDLRLNVLCDEPIWEFKDSDYLYSMSLNAQIQNLAGISQDVNDMVGAFVGDECRGIAHIVQELLTGEPRDSVWTDEHSIVHTVQVVDTLLNKFMVYLDIHSNLSSGETITFRYWDASDCEEYWEIDQKVDFQANQIIGTLKNPYLLTSTGKIAQDIKMHSGWNWFSTYVDNVSEKMNVNHIFSHDSHFGASDRIIHHTDLESFSINTDNWVPGKMVIQPESMYMIHLSNATDVKLIGNETSFAGTVFDMSPGWNWLGYPFRNIMPLNEAFDENDFAQGSMIKTENSFAEYQSDLDIWTGSLKFMKPGQGYLFYSPAIGNIRFDYRQVSRWNSILQKVNMESSNVENAKEFNMSAIIELDSTLSSDFHNPEIVASLNGNLISIGEFVESPYEHHRKICFLSIPSDSLGGENIQIGVREAGTESSDAVVTIPFRSNSILGTVKKPFQLSKVKSSPVGGILIYPNPASEWFNILVNVPSELKDKKYQFDLLDLTGRFIVGISEQELSEGSHEISWKNQLHISQGFYFVRIRVEQKSELFKVFIK